MNLSRPFIERPVATALLMVALLLVGLMAYEGHIAGVTDESNVRVSAVTARAVVEVLDQ